MKLLSLVLSSLLVYLIQTTFVLNFRFYGVAANLPLIYVVMVALLFGNRVGLAAAFLSGLLLDVLYSQAVGINIFIFCAIAILIDLFDEALFKDNSLTPLILIVAGTAVYHGLFLAHAYFFNLPIISGKVVAVIAIESVLNALIGLLLYKYVVRRWFGYELR
ncbi:rod shape-determining protein MreD [Acidaminobacter hydrogenoformans]|uniref:Rod shape-determining protein MreD n=1 Tax=Acidaminobacter hydrogenoformans DSM 2784 TaxID=1120920 RepID=A0A1G5RU19_9FIRM|nr:rod shape-determining protein MreD [Acidaminobacter hydrogenoformans]SCZ77210.1 rod shape-determining protein MreD [Acidaminobacter hydrogenoformans DSM 2784]